MHDPVYQIYVDSVSEARHFVDIVDETAVAETMEIYQVCGKFAYLTARFHQGGWHNRFGRGVVGRRPAPLSDGLPCVCADGSREPLKPLPRPKRTR